MDLRNQDSKILKNNKKVNGGVKCKESPDFSLGTVVSFDLVPASTTDLSPWFGYLPMIKGFSPKYFKAHIL
jgi:hypothetical protein